MKNLTAPNLALVVIFCALLSVFAFSILSNFTLSKEEIVKVCQDESEVSDGSIPYCITIGKRNFLFKSQAEIWATAGGNNEYGHRIVIGSSLEKLSDLKETEIEWTDEGAEIIFTSDHIISIPEKYLSGGR